MAVHTPTTDSESDDGSRKMELVYFSNDFPKDDLPDVFRRLHNHGKDKHFPILAQFIHEATWAIKDEVRQLPTELKQLIPPFNTPNLRCCGWSVACRRSAGNLHWVSGFLC